MSGLTFRRRILLSLVALGTVPAAIAVIGWALAVRAPWSPGDRTRSALDSVARTGRTLVETVDSTRLSSEERRALGNHVQALNAALSRVKRQEALSSAYSAILAATILVLGAVVLYASVRLGGYLSRQLSRPIDELVGWTVQIGRQRPLPADEREGGAPEFQALRGALRSMAAGLTQARGRELEAERLRAFRELARRVAHEMKNPLTPIRFAVRGLTATATPGQQESLEVLRAEADRLERLAQEFTEMGRLPEGPAAEVDVAELLDELRRTLVPSQYSVRLEQHPATPRVVGHYEPLRRAFDNLIRNALEAGPGSQGILLRCGPADDDGVEVRIIDHGSGVPAELQDRLFDPYVTGGKPGGTGLGLAIVRQSIEAHGGQVRYEATPGGGATFVVTLPPTPRPDQH
jgi:signal transduction histidine kinase